MLAHPPPRDDLRCPVMPPSATASERQRVAAQRRKQEAIAFLTSIQTIRPLRTESATFTTSRSDDRENSSTSSIGTGAAARGGPTGSPGGGSPPGGPLGPMGTLMAGSGGIDSHSAALGPDEEPEPPSSRYPAGGHTNHGSARADPVKGAEEALLTTGRATQWYCRRGQPFAVSTVVCRMPRKEKEKEREEAPELLDEHYSLGKGKRRRAKKPTNYAVLLGNPPNGSLLRHLGETTDTESFPSENGGVSGVGASAFADYHPFFLDDPDKKTEKNRKLVSLPSYRTSIIPYVKRKELKASLNEQFFLQHPWLEDRRLSLTKIRSAKRHMLVLATDEYEGMLDVSTIAYAITYFERLVIKRLVSKENRKLIAAGCLLLAAKFLEPTLSKTSMTRLVHAISDEFRTQPKKIFGAEFQIFACLEFQLVVPLELVWPHFERLLGSCNLTAQEYTTDNTIRVRAVAGL
eukprot:TRINITY_DN81204_c0_g1_i1.p1 TRINITY_DN81204_c0_g1~~TRINITY_DN81204_c0_g1_i1.p1  ORF type:complete len:462 (-),score=73.54 TRINITY_DN81204_c0_g1_i1:35-1420(-)